MNAIHDMQSPDSQHRQRRIGMGGTAARTIVGLMLVGIIREHMRSGIDPLSFILGLAFSRPH